MGTKFAVAVGLGIGYVLGTRAGRARYEQIRDNAAKLRRVPVVARPLDAAGEKVAELVRAGGERVTDKVADAIKERLFGAPSSRAHVSGDDVIDVEVIDEAPAADPGAQGSTAARGGAGETRR